MNQKLARQQAAVIIGIWVLTLWACIRILVAPEITRQSEALSYSLDNALSYLRHIAAKPHPVGSPAHDTVAGYLLKQIAALGYRAEVQETIASAQFTLPKPFIKAARIKNIMVRVAGKLHRDAVLISGHYDSAETSPGAADDGTAMASMLEVLRILKQSGPPQNDLILLFSDAEELGLLGSRAFVERHPWAKDCRLALNFEARGNKGTLLMFETSERNAQLIEHYAQSSVHPVASSLMFSVYKKLLHNDTDFSVFREAGMPGMNFAFIEGGTDYHTQLDNLERLDPRTLALQGKNMLELARHFADADLSTLGQDGDLGYFNLPFGKLFLFSLDDHLPLHFASITWLSFTLLVFAVGYPHRNGIRQYFLQGAIFLLQVGLIAGINFVLHAGLMRVYENYRQLPEPYNATLYFFAACCMTTAAFMLIHAGLRRWIKLHEFSAVIVWLWLAAGIYLALEFPGGVFFAVVPGLMMAVDWTFRLFWSGLRQTLITGICSSAVLVIVAPTLYLAHHALGFHADWLLMIITVLTLGLLSPAVDMLYRALGQKLPVFFLGAAVILLIQADRSSDFSRDRPRPDSIIYAWDGVNNTARWLSYDTEPDAWTRQFLTAAPAITQSGIFEDFVPIRRMLVKETPPVRLLATPDVVVVRQQITEGKKYLGIRIRSRRNAPLIRLSAETLKDTLQIYADNQLIYQKNNSVLPPGFIEFHGLRAEGIIFTFVLPAATRMKTLEIVEIRPDLDEIRQANFKPRPENTFPMRSSSLMPVDAVILRQSYPL
ncbi:MAG: M20/M25/M40 family metallo-hydrolase [Methylomicrobium sp.]